MGSVTATSVELTVEESAWEEKVICMVELSGTLVAPDAGLMEATENVALEEPPGFEGGAGVAVLGETLAPQPATKRRRMLENAAQPGSDGEGDAGSIVGTNNPATFDARASGRDVRL